MRSLVIVLVAILFAPCPNHVHGQKDPYAAHIAPTGPRAPDEQMKLFRLPPGFEIQLVAGDPDLRKPINIAFDAKGRLWVTESVEYPFPVKEGAKSRDTVKILEQIGPHGRAGKITTFAENLNIPIGVLPYRDGAIVYSIPNIERFYDTDGDGKADKREILYSGFGYQDTHGMTGEFMWGFDGWIYVCHGFANTSTVKAKDGTSIKMHSGNTYRIKPDGSKIEHYTFGQVNPFGLSYDPLGNLYSVDCHSRPIYQLLRGAYYPSFAKPHDGLGFGPEMMKGFRGSTALAGIAYYAASDFPPEFRDNIYIGDVVRNRVYRDRLEWTGSTPKAVAMPDFIRCDDPWFRPVDIKLGPDGALYIADFYTKIIGHYEVPLNHPQRDNQHGRIWRVVYRGDANGKKDAGPSPFEDFTKLKVPQLVQRLAHTNLTVRLTAANELVERGGKAGIDAVREMITNLAESTPFQRIHGLWVLERQAVLDDKILIAAARDKDTGVRVHAMRILAERSKLNYWNWELVIAGLKDTDAFVVRGAVEVMGRHPDKANLPLLLDLLDIAPKADTHLVHMIRMSLRDQLRAETTKHLLTSGTTMWREKDARAIADVCTGMPSALAGNFLLTHLKRHAEPLPRLQRYVYHVARHATSEVFQQELAVLVRDVKRDYVDNAALLKEVLRGLQERGMEAETALFSTAEHITKLLLGAHTDKAVLAGTELASIIKSQNAEQQLVTIVTGKDKSEAQRRAAAQALVTINSQRHLALLSRILHDAREPITLREQVANSLAGTNQSSAHGELLKVLTAAPARLEKSIAIALAGSRQGAEKLLAAIEAGKASARLLQERPVEVKLRQAKIPNLEARLAKLTKGLPSADERLQQLLNRQREAFVKTKAEVALGAKLFEKHCAACHQIANKGSKIAPQLDGIGVRGLERLLEDILDPHRNVDQAFRTTNLTLTNGQTISGLFLRQEGAVFVIADNQGKEVRVAAKSVEQRTISPLSPMPSNFAEVMSQSEFAHMLGYLLQQRRD